VDRRLKEVEEGAAWSAQSQMTQQTGEALKSMRIMALGTPGCGDGIALGRIEAKELDEAIAKAKSGQVPGLDGLPAEAWKALDQGRASVLTLMSRCWEKAEVPEQWRQSMVVGTFRKGGATDPANYRPSSCPQPTIYSAG